MARSDRPTVFTVCGLPGAGKTRFARELARDRGAVCFSADEWVLSLYGPGLPVARFGEFKARVWEQIWRVAARLLELGVSVVLDFSFYLRSDRADFRRRAAAAGADFRIYYLECSVDVARARVQARNRRPGMDTFSIGARDFDQLVALLEPPSRQEEPDVVRVQAALEELELSR
ncbi:MAG: ATP-binding protein [Myxococcales bacterium]|jgi:predicted kinase